MNQLAQVSQTQVSQAQVLQAHTQVLRRQVTDLISDPKHFDRILSATISLIGLYSSITQTYEIEILTLFIIYYLNDLKKKTAKEIDFIIHHILGIGASLIAVYIKYNNLPAEPLRNMFINMEITTPIYILSLYIENIYTKFLFFISFSYCRIYVQYTTLKELNLSNVSNTYFVFYGLFALNLYWYTIMIKKLSKPFKDPKYIVCYKYIPYIGVFGQYNKFSFYSLITNYLYHEDIYTAIMNKTNIEKYISPQTIIYSIVNSLVSISSIKPRYYKYSIPVHLCKLFNIDEIIPLGVDTFFYFSTDAMIIYYIFILVRTIKPFYNMNPFMLQVILILLKKCNRLL